MKRTLLPALAACLFVLVTSVTLAHAQTASGRVVGTVSNGTRNAAAGSTANLPVNLFQMASNGPISRTVQTDAQGRFAFDGLVTDASQPFFVRVDYAGLKYFSDFLVFQSNSNLPVTMTVYETMPTPADLHVDQVHVILNVGGSVLEGEELISILNPVDRAFLLPLTMPEGAGNLTFNDVRDQFRAQTLPDGRVAMPILPAETQLVVGFMLPVEPPNHTLTLRPTYAIDSFNLLVADTNGVQVNGPHLSPGQTFTTQSGARYLQISGTGFQNGETITANLSNLPGADTWPLTRNLLVGAGAVAAIALLAWPLARRRRQPALAPAVDPSAQAERRIELVRAIAALDDAQEGNALDKDEYAARRAALKAELVAMNGER